MQKIFYTLFMMLLLSAAASAQAGWITQRLDDKIAVKFPAEPQKMAKSGADSYTLQTRDSLLYSAALVDYNVLLHVDSVTLASVKDTQNFADGVRNGMAGQKPNYTFSNITVGKWKGNTLYTVSGTENNNRHKVALQMILIGTKMYIFSYRVLTAAVTPAKEIYFNSIELLK